MGRDQRFLPKVGRCFRGRVGTLDRRDLEVDYRDFVKTEFPLLKMSRGKLIAGDRSLDPNDDEKHEYHGGCCDHGDPHLHPPTALCRGSGFGGGG